MKNVLVLLISITIGLGEKWNIKFYTWLKIKKIFKTFSQCSKLRVFGCEKDDDCTRGHSYFKEQHQGVICDPKFQWVLWWAFYNNSMLFCFTVFAQTSVSPQKIVQKKWFVNGTTRMSKSFLYNVMSWVHFSQHFNLGNWYSKLNLWTLNVVPTLYNSGTLMPLEISLIL